MRNSWGELLCDFMDTKLRNNEASRIKAVLKYTKMRKRLMVHVFIVCKLFDKEII